MLKKIVIVNYGMGNLFSVQKKMTKLGANVIVSSNPNDISFADKIILPGVGHFEKAMSNLNELNLISVLNNAVLVSKIPILGICLGMQLMAKHSEEGNVMGLGWFESNVVKLKVKDTLKYKIPHIGWNQIKKSKKSKLMNNIPDYSEFYFVHSYHIINKNTSDILNETEYECKFTSAVEKDNIFGVQYHPEKSHDIGEVLLKNFIHL